MADNYVTNAGVGGSTFAADDIGGVLFPRGKLGWGADGFYGDASLTNAIPIQAGTGATFTVVDGGGTISVDDGGGTVSIDDGGSSITVDGSVSVTGNVDVTPASPLANDYLPVRLTDGSAFLAAVPVTDNAGSLSVDDNGGSITVDGTIAATQSGVWTVSLSASVPAGTNNIGDVDVLTLPSLPAGGNTIGAVTQASGPWSVAGAAAHDAAVSGNPVLLGGAGRRARATATDTDGDATRLVTDPYGRLTTAGIDLTAVAAQVTASGDTDLVAAPGANLRLKILRVEGSNSHATTALTAGLKSASLNSGAVFGKRFLPAAGGAGVWNFPGGHLLCGVNEKLSANLSAVGQVEYTVYYETVRD